MKKSIKSILTIIPLLLSVSCSSNSDNLSTSVKEEYVNPVEKTSMEYHMSDYVEHNYYDIDSCPSSGKVNLLVIPVWFTDSSKYIKSENKKAETKAEISNAYFGSNEDTGWRSVKTYYEEDSYGKLHFSGEVTDWYECGYTASRINSYDTPTDIAKNAVEWYKNQNPNVNMKKYDSDGDGFLDGVCLIYAAPDYSKNTSMSEAMWAYCYWVMDNSLAKVSDPGVNSYFWASYDFMDSGENDVNIDTHTYIHETGHLFGLEDYYDYSQQYKPAGGFSMQDYNVASHDPYSKIALDWIDPYVINEGMFEENNITELKIYLKPMQENGDCLILSKTSVFSPFDEYLIFEYYTPTGLNQFDNEHQYVSQGMNYPTGTDESGIRIWHVDSRLTYVKSKDSTNFTSVTNSIQDGNYYYFATSNTRGNSINSSYASIIPSYQKYYQLALLQNRKNASFDRTTEFSSKDLFQEGDNFDMDTYSKQFYNGKFDKGKTLNLSVEMNEQTDEGCFITIKLVD